MGINYENNNIYLVKMTGELILIPETITIIIASTTIIKTVILIKQFNSQSILPVLNLAVDMFSCILQCLPVQITTAMTIPDVTLVLAQMQLSTSMPWDWPISRGFSFWMSSLPLNLQMFLDGGSISKLNRLKPFSKNLRLPSVVLRMSKTLLNALFCFQSVSPSN